MIESNTHSTTLPLLGADEPPAVELVNVDGAGSAVLVCDHASNRVPYRLGTLGLDAVQLADHIGWDAGAAEVARRLSADLDAPLVLSGYSRLVIDCNRPLHNAGSIAEQSAGVPVPGNQGLTPEAREARIDSTVQTLPPRHRSPARRPFPATDPAAQHSQFHADSAWPASTLADRRLPLAQAEIRRTCCSGRSSAMQTFRVGDNEPYPIEDGCRLYHPGAR